MYQEQHTAGACLRLRSERAPPRYRRRRRGGGLLDGGGDRWWLRRRRVKEDPRAVGATGVVCPLHRAAESGPVIEIFSAGNPLPPRPLGAWGRDAQRFGLGGSPPAAPKSDGAPSPSVTNDSRLVPSPGGKRSKCTCEMHLAKTKTRAKSRRHEGQAEEFSEARRSRASKETCSHEDGKRGGGARGETCARGADFIPVGART